MAFATGDMCIAAGVFPQPAGGGAALLTKGTLCPDGIVFGTFLGNPDPSFVKWNTGRPDGSSSYSPTNLRLVTPYTGTDLVGKTVRLVAGVAPAFEGVVVLCFNTELDNTNADGTQVPVCLVKAQGFYYVAEPTSLEVV